MTHRFKQHYSRDEARALLPQIREWLRLVAEARRRFTDCDRQLAARLGRGEDLGGEPVHQWLRTLVEIRTVLAEFEKREIQVKDVDRGLIDFPAILAGREVFLCWEQDEDDIEFWHDLETGYAGRERL